MEEWERRRLEIKEREEERQGNAIIIRALGLLLISDMRQIPVSSALDLKQHHAPRLLAPIVAIFYFSNVVDSSECCKFS
jgi:hypothetical protein